ncbi:MAG: hypothetical protein WCC94_01335 [Candidatus Bathyarchaeia archaeon]
MDGTIRDIHNYPVRLSRAIRHLLNNNKVSNENRLAILRFTAHMGVVERVCMARMTFYVPKLERLAELLGKNFVDATEDDIRSVVGKLNTMKVRLVRKKGEQVLASDRPLPLQHLSVFVRIEHSSLIDCENDFMRSNFVLVTCRRKVE